MKKNVSLFLALLLALFNLSAGFNAAAADIYTGDITVYCSRTEMRNMLKSVNALRTGSDAWYWNETDTEKEYKNGLDELIYDYELEEAAIQRACELVLSYSHTRPDNTRCFTVGESYGENIAVGYKSAEAVFTAWEEADEPYSGQGHRRNMLSGYFRSFCAAHVVYNGIDFWVQEFGLKTSSTETPAKAENITRSVNVSSDLIVYKNLVYSDDEIRIEMGKSASLPEVKVDIVMNNYWSYAGTCLVKARCNYSVADTSVAKISGGKLVSVSPGETTLEISTFGESFTVPVIVVEVCETHSFDDGVITQKPTYTASGVKTYTCTVCGTAKTETVAKLKAPTVARVGGLKASKVAAKTITLTWSKAKNANKYEVYRSSDGKKWTKLTATTKLTYTDKSLKTGAKYQYKVRGVHSASGAKGSFSAELKTGTLTASPSITLKSAKAKTVTVTWKKVTGAAKYIVYKSSNNKKWTKAATVSKTSYTLSKLTSGKKIYVKVVSVNAYGKTGSASKVKSIKVR